MDFNNCTKWNVNRYVTANYLLLASFSVAAKKIHVRFNRLVIFVIISTFLCFYTFSFFIFIHLFIHSLFNDKLICKVSDCWGCKYVLDRTRRRHDSIPIGLSNFCMSATTKLIFFHYLTHTAKSNQSIYTVKRLFSMWLLFYQGFLNYHHCREEEIWQKVFFSRIKCIGNCNKLTETFKYTLSSRSKPVTLL